MYKNSLPIKIATEKQSEDIRTENFNILPLDPFNPTLVITRNKIGVTMIGPLIMSVIFHVPQYIKSLNASSQLYE